MSGSGSISRSKRGGSLSQQNQSLPPLDIQSIQMPSNPQNALAIKTAALSSNRSLYQICSELRKRLFRVEDFKPFFEQPPNAEPLDVVSHMCHVFRLGSPLCHLYNLLIPSFIDRSSGVYADYPEPRQIEYDFPTFLSSPQGVRNFAKRPENAKTCQKYIAVFCMAMKQRIEEGRWHSEPWALHELWGKSTGEDIEAYDSTGLMKVLQTVETMIENLPDTAIVEASPSTPHHGHMSYPSQHGHYGGPPLDLPFSLGGTASGASAVISMAATMNGGVHIDAESTTEDMQRSNSSADANAFKSVEELVGSEKSYVQELEILVRCSQEMVATQLISTDRCHAIFSNLSKILDFHRKFLIKLETEYEPIQEGQGARAWAVGRWGRPFVTSESEFTCYGPYCANYLDAMQTVTEQMPNLLRGQELGPADRPCLHPERELQAFMIKPIQRITKYQLLLDAILNTTAKHDYPYRAELEQGAAAVRRIAAAINEVTDFKAKQATVRELSDRVEDWKGHEVEKFGDLFLDEHFTVTKADQPREYHVFLFEKMMLCCKEVTPDRKEKKTKSALRKDKGRSNTVQEKKKLALKGRIFVCNINRATLAVSSEALPGRLTIAWTVPHRHPSGYSEDVEDYFVMTGKADDTLKKWADKVMELAEKDRRRQDLNRQARDSSRLSQSSQFQGTSQWAPMTPATETPSFTFPPPLPSHGGYMVEDDEDESGGGYRSGRGTPSLAGSAMGYYPASANTGRRAQSQQGMTAPSYQPEHRTRAATEDQTGPSITQWRQQGQQQPHMPPMPRLMSTQSSMSTASEMSFGHSAGRPSIGRGSSRLGPSEEVDEGSETTTSYSQRYPSQRGMMSRAPSQGVQSTPYPTPLIRNRSASTPNVYQQPQVASSSSSISRPLPGMAEYAAEPEYEAGSSSTLIGAAMYSSQRGSAGGKRSSSESQSTETSDDSSGPSPATPYASQSGDIMSASFQDMAISALAAGAAILIRVKCGECQFSVGVPFEITYPMLHQKIVKKIRLFRGNEPSSLTIKWIDAEGDEISLKCDADVEAMFDEAREECWKHINLVAKG